MKWKSLASFIITAAFSLSTSPQVLGQLIPDSEDAERGSNSGTPLPAADNDDNSLGYTDSENQTCGNRIGQRIGTAVYNDDFKPGKASHYLLYNVIHFL
uniref:Roundabout homolog 1-like n=1 Tax=Geotrypetes seraphini TaxID=260995 RepID=A0A6P8RCE0_GEOSA|nr:roundabout homolog 1-like [Geotrypetes seraphini]